MIFALGTSKAYSCAALRVWVVTLVQLDDPFTTFLVEARDLSVKPIDHLVLDVIVIDLTPDLDKRPDDRSKQFVLRSHGTWMT